MFTLSAPATAEARSGPIAVQGAVLLRNGKPFRAFGINAAGLADDILAQGHAATASFRAIEYLGGKHVPFIRFWASYFNNWKPYRKTPQPTGAIWIRW